MMKVTLSFIVIYIYIIYKYFKRSTLYIDGVLNYLTFKLFYRPM